MAVVEEIADAREEAAKIKKQASTVPEDAASRHEEATKIKDQGNAAFKEHRYHKAIHHYTESLRLEPNHLVFGNRAQSYISVKQYELALRDLNAALAMNPSYVKNTSRRSKVLAHLGMITKARVDNKETLKHAPNDKNARMEAAALKGKFNARYVVVKQWDSGAEFEEDAMVPIPIGGVIYDPDTVDHPVEPVPPTQPTAVVAATEEKHTVAPPVASEEVTVSKTVEEKVPAEKSTVVVDTVPTESDATESDTTVAEETVLEAVAPRNEDTVDNAIAPSEEVTVPEEQEKDTAVESAVAVDEEKNTVSETEKNTVLEKNTVPVEQENDTVAEDTVAIEELTPETAPLPQTSPAKSSSSLTFLSAAEIRSPSGGSNESWEDMKNESRESTSISDMHSTGGAEDEYTTSPSSLNHTLDREDSDVEVEARKEEVKEMEEKVSPNQSMDSDEDAAILESIHEATVTEEDEEAKRVSSKSANQTMDSDEEVETKEDEDEEKASPKPANQMTDSDDEEEVKKEVKEEVEKVVEQTPATTVPDVPTVPKQATVVKKPIVIPPPARNFFDFVIHFNQLKDEPKAFGKYFLSIPAPSLLAVFSNLLQDDHVKAIVAGLKEAASEESADLSLIASSLYAVCLLPRFDLLVLFMNDADRDEALSLIDILPACEETQYIREFFH